MIASHTTFIVKKKCQNHVCFRFMLFTLREGRLSMACFYHLKIVTYMYICFEKDCPNKMRLPQCGIVLWVMVVHGCLKEKI